MLMPKKTKYRKMFKGRIKGKAQKGNTVVYGDFGLVSVDKAKITSRQIEAARIAINRYLKRGGDVVIRIFPHKPITKRPAEVRMGKGKGPLEGYVAPIMEGAELREDSFRLRFKLSTGELEDTSKIKQTRKDIARIKTILAERRKQEVANGK